MGNITDEKKQSESIFDAFTNKYALSKTLRFELKPVGETLENMKEAFRYDKEMQTFFVDQEIEDAYQNLKPIFDAIHEDFINESLESEKAKQIPFYTYEESYKKKSELSKKEFEAVEKKIRGYFDEVYKEVANHWKQNSPKNKKGKEVFTKNSPALLTEAGILEYIRQNTEKFSHILSKEQIEKYLQVFDGFFTYFSGFNQNRENYYTTKDEKATAVATRVVSENLPKFCDNTITFENKKNEYLCMYQALSESGRTLEIKDGTSGKMRSLKEVDEKIFSIGHFNQCLSQKEIENYNDHIANANYLINLYNQIQNDKKNRLRLFKTLYKQIGCGEKSTFIKKITHYTEEDAQKAREKKESAISLEQELQEFGKLGNSYFFGRNNDGFIKTIEDFKKYLLEEKEDFTGVYWSKKAINTISSKYFSNWHDLKDVLKNAKVFNESSSKDEEVSIPEVVELEKLFSVLDSIENWKEEDVLFRKTLTEEVSEDHRNFEKNKKRKQLIEESEKPSQALLEMIFDDMFDFREIFSSEKENALNASNYKTKEERNAIIKQWMDSGIYIVQILKYFFVREKKIKGTPLDAKLKEGLDTLFLINDDSDWFTLYDRVRSFLTKKPQDDAKENKLKLNFENSTLASGWDINKESDNSCVILRDKEKMFLAVMRKSQGKDKNSGLFRKTNKNPLFDIENVETIEKMEYKLLPGPNKMLPKCLFPKSNPKKYGASDKVLEIYKKGSFKKSESNFSKQDLYALIDFYKEALKKYEGWNCFVFHFRNTDEYKDISEFYLDIEKQGYILNFIPINKDILEQYIRDGKIYFFEIRNKDWNGLVDGSKKKSASNLHTLYWKALFEERENRPKLNGEAEIFYRKSLSKDQLEKTIDKNGKEIIKNYRFSQEKFIFHVPITLNFCLKNNKINDIINEKLLENESVCFLGIDRGEKHLAYYSIVDKEGNILEQDTLNSIKGKDYNDLLEKRSEKMDKDRKSWQTIGTIKELKDGYISQVIRKIVNLSLRYNAFIVLEDLNVGFKQGRQKIEKSVYQKLELALAKKLNFLVDKSASLGEAGSVTRALQLTPPVNTFGDMENRKQFGIMLYTRANYTSQTDPATGWRKTIYLKRGSEELIKKSIFEVFDDIYFDGKDYVFSYTEKFGKEKKLGKSWRLYSGKNGISLDRFRGKRGKDFDEWNIEKIDIVEILDGLFEDFDKGYSLLEQIKKGENLKKINEHTAYETLRFAIDCIQQIRNSGKKDDERNSDFLQSPVRDENEDHYDSRVCWDKEISGERVLLPTSGDANGAYNIARKGTLMREHLRRDFSLYISDEEWSVWLSGKDAWEKWIKENEKDLKKKKR